MFKLVVLSLVLAGVSAAPGLLGGYAVPAATSYSSRIDVHSKPIVTAYTAPVITKTVVASPVGYAYSGLDDHLGYGLHSAPLVSGYSVGHDYGLGYGYGIAGHGYNSYGHEW